MNSLFNNNWYYNPQYFNQQEYLRYQAEIQAYEQHQTEEMSKAVKAWDDFLNAIQKIDPDHQQAVQVACLLNLGSRMRW